MKSNSKRPKPSKTATASGSKTAPKSNPEVVFPSLTFDPSRRILRPNEVAAKLDCDIGHIYDLIDDGLIRAINLTGKNCTQRRTMRIPIESYQAFLNASQL